MLECMKRYTFVLVRLGRFDEADALIRDTTAMTPGVEYSLDGESWMWDQGRVLSARGRLEDAGALYHAVLSRACEQLALAQPALSSELDRYQESLSASITDQGLLPDYLPIIATLRKNQSYGVHTVAFRAMDLAVLECRMGRHDRALPIFQRCLDVVAAQVPPLDRELARVKLAHAECLLHTGDKEAAVRILSDAYESFLKVFGEGNQLTSRAAGVLRRATDPDWTPAAATPDELYHAGFD